MMPEDAASVPREAGFTLIELLVAMALVGLLVAGLFGGLRFGARASERAGATTEHTSQLAFAYDFLHAQLGNAQPYPASADPKEPEIIFTGGPDGLELITTAPSQLALGGFFHLRLGVAGETRRLQILVRWQDPPRPDDTSGQSLKPTVLLDRLASVRFAYFGITDPAVPAEWHDGWENARALPKMIRLRVRFADGWLAPDLILAPRLAEAVDVDG
ncbi:MAG: prepilin-type N-terminal cleavage/methylation domain-containing protein [Alphaproteobacteria bacterium]|nr:prepilin-type N-terminal cleavage/methylation domain-containing protein [Alphaproteobacteria bacterium]